MYTIKTLSILLSLCWLFSSCAEDSPKTADYTSVNTSVPETTEQSIPDTTQEEMASIDLLEKDSVAKEITTEDPEKADKSISADKALSEKVTKKEKTKAEIESEIRAKERRRKRREARKNSKATISFEETVYKFPRISQGEKINHKFKFTNTGTKALVISNAKATCGCTQPSFPFVPIAPGEEGYIGVVFDSKGRLGRQKPMITVTTNAKPATYEIYLEGYVDSPEEMK